MNNKLTIVTIALACILSACSKKVRDVPYYIDHPDEREKVIKDCYANPGEKAGSPNCINANQAQEKEAMKKNFRPFDPNKSKEK